MQYDKEELAVLRGLQTIKKRCDKFDECDGLCKYSDGSECVWLRIVGTPPAEWNVSEAYLDGRDITFMKAVGANSAERINETMVELKRDGERILTVSADSSEFFRLLQIDEEAFL